MEVRTAEIVAVLALAGDLATGAPFEHGLRSTTYAAALAAEFDLPVAGRHQAFYLTALSGAGTAANGLAELLSLGDVLGSEQAPAIVVAIAVIARDLDRQRREHPAGAARALVRSRWSTPLEQRIAEAAVELPEPDADSAWDDMLAAEPEPVRLLGDADLEPALAALGLFGTLVSPYFRGHSAAVSALATLAAEQRGLPPGQVQLVRRAGLVHDLGRTGVAREVWESPGPLAVEDGVQVRARPERSEHLLARVPWLAAIGRVSVPGGAAEPAAILAAADAYCALIADRPHRPAMSPAAAATVLRADAAAGRFDADVVESVLYAAGVPTVPQRS